MQYAEIHQTMRLCYMNNEILHEEYYSWLANFIGADRKSLPVSDERLLQSTDEHLNDIPLKRWDSMDYSIRKLAYAKKLPWSLADTVCTLKAIARQRINELKSCSI
jgi:hypothetical protein